MHSKSAARHGGNAMAEHVAVMHTLGPRGTNCEAAARHWFALQGRDGQIVLHETLEAAVGRMPRDPAHALLGCAVYPDLHSLVFGNLDRMALADSFVMPTLNMVLAARDGAAKPRSVVTHPAPRGLAPAECERLHADSNAQAAIDCAAGRADACITTLSAAQAQGLAVIRDFGPVPMVFTIHAQHGSQP